MCFVSPLCEECQSLYCPKSAISHRYSFTYPQLLARNNIYLSFDLCTHNSGNTANAGKTMKHRPRKIEHRCGWSNVRVRARVCIRTKGNFTTAFATRFSINLFISIRFDANEPKISCMCVQRIHIANENKSEKIAKSIRVKVMCL